MVFPASLSLTFLNFYYPTDQHWYIAVSIAFSFTLLFFTSDFLIKLTFVICNRFDSGQVACEVGLLNHVKWNCHIKWRVCLEWLEHLPKCHKENATYSVDNLRYEYRVHMWGDLVDIKHLRSWESTIATMQRSGLKPMTLQIFKSSIFFTTDFHGTANTTFP